MKTLLAGLLTPVSELLFKLVMAVPMGVVRAFVFGIIAALVLWILRMSPQVPETKGEKPYSLFSDLRIFALVVLIIQAALYIIF